MIRSVFNFRLLRYESQGTNFICRVVILPLWFKSSSSNLRSWMITLFPYTTHQKDWRFTTKPSRSARRVFRNIFANWKVSPRELELSFTRSVGVKRIAVNRNWVNFLLAVSFSSRWDFAKRGEAEEHRRRADRLHNRLCQWNHGRDSRTHGRRQCRLLECFLHRFSAHCVW